MYIMIIGDHTNCKIATIIARVDNGGLGRVSNASINV